MCYAPIFNEMLDFAVAFHYNNNNNTFRFREKNLMTDCGLIIFRNDYIFIIHDYFVFIHFIILV